MSVGEKGSTLLKVNSCCGVARVIFARKAGKKLVGHGPHQIGEERTFSVWDEQVRCSLSSRPL